MQYFDFQGMSLSRLGFGAMRLPTNPDGTVDEAQTARMTDYAIAHGVNYFDTAHPYHEGFSEVVMGRILKNYPKDKWYLATKYPGHQLASRYDPEEIFEEQLKKCQTDCFDFYLLHNVYESSFEVYTDPKWGILPYFVEQKKRGRIRHLGFSTHARPDLLERFLDLWGSEMEFCQIQLNYLDWTLQEGKRKYDLLTERGIPVWVMESIRGGRLANLSPENNAQLKALRPDESVASWALRWLQELPNVGMILSGMSNEAQMIDNVKTFCEDKPLSASERTLLEEIAEGMKDSIPCTGCRYCCSGCPMGLDIPTLLSAYNDFRFDKGGSGTASHMIEALPDDKKPSACLGCGACAQICPQKIDIPAALKDLADRYAAMPKWSDISRAREEAARRLKEGKA